MFQSLRSSRYRDTCMYIFNVLLIRLLKIRRQFTTGFTLFGRLETSQTRDSAVFQVSLSKNQISLQVSSCLILAFLYGYSWQCYFIQDSRIRLHQGLVHVTTHPRCEEELSQSNVLNSIRTINQALLHVFRNRPWTCAEWLTFCSLHARASLCALTVFGSLYVGPFACTCSTKVCLNTGARWLKWLGRKFTDRKVRGSNSTSASRLPLSRLGQPDSTPAPVLPSGGMAVKHRKGATAERFFS
ncbi:hypothetical protein T265_07225 [Opisthorchis viverrini]|uniref:Uncharacterized protein n=1 Tax=Opisthorchis viverrini TaxID=6198 RepID=A0A075AC59_OPIVI|nr:hypothetical protein T265_07225 [Opisthorchis viverrini]KER25284.1 hypothetical protein T265_07225 [Opisthorchis viverrini]